MNNNSNKLKMFLIRNAVPIVFLIISAIAIPISRFSMTYLLQEMLIRLSRNSFLVLSLLVPMMLQEIRSSRQRRTLSRLMVFLMP